MKTYSFQNNYDMIEYVNQLRDGILVAYVGIVQGFKGTEKGNCRPYTFDFSNRVPSATPAIWSDVCV
jgi:importin subunit beta-1